MAVTTTSRTPSPGRWQRCNAWVGYLVFGLPAVAAGPALMVTVARFGMGQALLGAGGGALAACVPLLLWVRFTRRGPSSRTGKLTWAVLATATVSALLASPLFFWSGPALLVVLSEVLRRVAGTSRASATSTIRARRQSLVARTRR